MSENTLFDMEPSPHVGRPMLSVLLNVFQKPMRVRACSSVFERIDTGVNL